IASSRYLEAVIEESRPDLLHFSQFYYGALRCDVPRVVVAHSDVVSWWVTVRKEQPPETDWLRWYRQAVAQGLSTATSVVAPSRWMLGQIALYYGRPTCGSVIHNGRNPSLFNPHMSKEEKIVTIGRLWDCGKNAALLLRQEMPAPVHIVGSDRHPELQNSAFDAEAVRPNAHLEPKMEEIQIVHTLGLAGIYAAPSQSDPFVLAPLEAALSRCALVASDIPSFRELWDGVAVFFADNDADSLRDAVGRLLRDPGLRCRQANLAYRHALRHYNARRMVDDYMALYHSLVPARAVSA